MASTAPANGEWPYYGGDLGSTRYSPLDQIDRDNVSELEIVWRWSGTNLGPRPDYNFRATPIMMNGVLLHHRRLETLGGGDRSRHG